MPKELTHLLIAETARRRYLEKNPRSVLVKKLESVQAYFLIGAVIHDIAFCGSKTADGVKLKEKGRAVHGSPPNDTIRPLRYLAGQYNKENTPEMLALTAGAVTHIMTDATFHPFVFYYTGDDISRHYRFETLMDTHLFHKQKTWLEQPVSPPLLYSNLKQHLPFLAGHLSGFLGLSEGDVPEILKAFKLHAFTVKAFRSRLAYYFYRLKLSLGPEEDKRLIHLFYPPGMRFNTSFFDQDFFYRHPSTGIPETIHLNGLIERSVQKACEGFENLETAMAGGDLVSAFRDMAPISLETGLAPSSRTHFQYTDLSKSIDDLVLGL